MDVRRTLAFLITLAALSAVASLVFVATSVATAPGAAAAQPPSPDAASRHLPGGSTISGTLVASDTWGPGVITVTGDISVAAGVVISIVPHTKIQMVPNDGANLGLDPNRVEYIVVGELAVSGPVTFTSQSPAPAGGDWYGIRFLPGSAGSLSSATVEYGVAGISAQDADLASLVGNTIRYMHGTDGADGANGFPGNPGGAGTNGSPGGPAYGLYLTGTSSAEIRCNLVYSITGGAGGSGGHGGAGIGGGANGGDGGAGNDGGPATGIFVGNGATPQVLTNTVAAIISGPGGSGGQGGGGADGFDGVAPGGPGGVGGDGGAGGSGGEGGDAHGIHFQAAGNGSAVFGNTVQNVRSGAGGAGGVGGNGGAGGDGGPGGDFQPGGPGGPGGNGGNGGPGGSGGLAVGIRLERSSAQATDNDVQTIVAGDGGAAGAGGYGGAAGNGGDAGYEAPGGPGGTPGAGGNGGAGGPGGEANGLRIDGAAAPSLLRNTVTGVLGGDGGVAGWGGHGGNGGSGGQAHGIRIQGPDASPSVADNDIVDVSAGSGGAGGLGGDGGTGGDGGRGGDGFGFPGPGMDGSPGQNGGDGGDGGPGGLATGIYVVETTIAPPVQRNAAAAIQGGAGGNSGAGGHGGLGGSGGDGGNDIFLAFPGGSGGNGGPGGDGGHGGDGGDGGDAAGMLSIFSAHDALNNLVHDVAAGDAGHGGRGGDGGSGGDGGDAGQLWVAGANWEGRGGNGGNGGDAGQGGDGGDSAGLHATGSTVDYFHNTSADIADGGAAGSAGSPPGGGGPVGNPGLGPGNPFPPPIPGMPGSAGAAGTAGDSMGLWATGGSTVTFVDNILAHISPPGANVYGVRVAGSAATLGYNDVWTHTVQYSGLAVPATDLAQDPQFLDWAGDDFHLDRGSPCVDAGTDVGLSDDRDGQPRPLGGGPDIGCDEVGPLAFSKAVNLDVAGIGWDLVYTLVVTNPDPYAPAMSGVLTDGLPAGVTFGGGPICNLPACAYVPESDAVAWMGDVPTSTVLTVVYSATVNRGLADGTAITNTAFFTTAAQSGWTNIVTTTVHTPIFTLTKEAEGASVAGLPFTYTVVVSNLSPHVAGNGLVVTDAVPAGGQWVSGGSYAGGVVTLTYTTILPGESASASWVVSTCQTALINQHYRVVTSTEGIDSGWGPVLTTGLLTPTLVPTFTLSADVVSVGQTVILTDQSTFDGAPLVAWRWAFGDGQVGYGTPVTHAYSETGSYSLTLTITDACGFASGVLVPDALEVVESCDAVTGVTIAGPDSGPPGTYTFTTSLTPSIPTPPITYLWDNGDTAATSIRSLGVGTHTLVVTVTNCIDVSVVDTHTVVISPPRTYLYLPLVIRQP